MGCVQQKQKERKHLESIDTAYQSNGAKSRQTTHQDVKKEFFKIQLNPIVQRRLSPQRSKQSDF